MTAQVQHSASPLQWARATLFVAGAAFAVTRYATPALALACGIALALTVGNPWPAVTGRFSSVLLQASVVGLGFGIPLGAVLRAGTTGIGYTVMLIAAVFAVGIAIGRWFRVDRSLAFLITAGTSICGGSAIAALGPAIDASRESMSVSLATVFVLNAVALYVFPPLGHFVHFTQHQFGVWAALAIHDTSSVVGAAASYGPEALRDATILKLTRALWILPLALIAPFFFRQSSGDRPTRRAPIPWFIGLFVLAAVARSLAGPGALPAFDETSNVARTTLVLTLFLIGANLTRTQLRAVGLRPFAQGLLLWLLVGSGTLAAIHFWVS